MHEDGMTIGSHAVNHKLMSRLKYSDKKYHWGIQS